MNPFMAPDIVGLCPPGVGANKAEPADNGPTVRELLDNLAAVHEAARTITVENVLADLLSLSLDDRSKVKMGLYDATRPVGDPPGAQTVRDMDQFELMHALAAQGQFNTLDIRARAHAFRASQAAGMEALGLYAWGYKRTLAPLAEADAKVDSRIALGMYKPGT